MPLITPLAEKLRLLAGTGLDATLVLPFDDDLRHLSRPRLFADQVLRPTPSTPSRSTKAKTSASATRHRSESTASDGLEQLGRSTSASPCCVYTPRTLRGHVVSSSRVRDLISTGDVRHARALLGRSLRPPQHPRLRPWLRHPLHRPHHQPRTPTRSSSPPTASTSPPSPIWRRPCSRNLRVRHQRRQPPHLRRQTPSAIESHLLNFHPIDLTEQTPLELAFLAPHPSRRSAGPSPEALCASRLVATSQRARRYFALCQGPPRRA